MTFTEFGLWITGHTAQAFTKMLNLQKHQIQWTFINISRRLLKIIGLHLNLNIIRDRMFIIDYYWLINSNNTRFSNIIVIFNLVMQHQSSENTSLFSQSCVGQVLHLFLEYNPNHNNAKTEPF